MSDPVTPNATFTSWLTDAAEAAQQVTEGLDWSTTGLLGGALAALGLAARFGHCFGPAGSLISSGVQAGLDMMKPQHKKQAEAKARVMEDSAWNIVEVIEQLPADNPLVQDIKKEISRSTPPEFNAFFDEWRRMREGGHK